MLPFQKNVDVPVQYRLISNFISRKRKKLCSKFMTTCLNYTFGQVSDCSNVQFWSGFGPGLRHFSWPKIKTFLGMKFKIFHSNGDIVNIACSLWHVQPKKEKTQCSEQHYSCGEKGWIRTLFLWISKSLNFEFSKTSAYLPSNINSKLQNLNFVIIGIIVWNKVWTQPKYFIMSNYRDEKFSKKEKILEWIITSIRKGSKTVSYKYR